jgi:methylglutaconyl-CoA hydratase
MPLDNDKGFVQTQINSKIATITFGHPASNSFPRDLINELILHINEANHNSDITIIILKSEGDRVFCAGASFDELLSITHLEESITFFNGFARLINTMRNCEKLIIARVQGKAVGGGVGIIAACDYAFGTETASIKLSEIAIGLGPFVIEPAVTRKIGKTAMSQLSLTANEWKSAQWAQEKVLFSEIFSTITEMDNALEKFATTLSNYNPEALVEMKKVFWENTSHWETLLGERAAISGKLALSDFTKEALKSFKK